MLSLTGKVFEAQRGFGFPVLRQLINSPERHQMSLCLWHTITLSVLCNSQWHKGQGQLVLALSKC